MNTIFCLLIFLGLGAFFWRHLRHTSEAPLDDKYAYGPLAQAKKAESESRDKASQEKKDFEAQNRFGIRMLTFIDALSQLGSPPPLEFSCSKVQDPYRPNSQTFVDLFEYRFYVEGAKYKLRVYKDRYAPLWLTKVEATAFFRIVEIVDQDDKQVLRVLIRFIAEHGEETYSGTVLESLERGPWVKEIRQVLMEFEKKNQSQPDCKRSRGISD